MVAYTPRFFQPIRIEPEIGFKVGKVSGLILGIIERNLSKISKKEKGIFVLHSREIHKVHKILFSTTITALQ